MCIYIYIYIYIFVQITFPELSLSLNGQHKYTHNRHNNYRMESKAIVSITNTTSITIIDIVTTTNIMFNIMLVIISSMVFIITSMYQMYHYLNTVSIIYCNNYALCIIIITLSTTM